MKISKPHFTLGLITAAVLALTACGGGGGGTTGTGATPVAMSAVTTTVMDGLIENALVCVDSNNNGMCETTETQGHTDVNGKVTITIPTADLATAKLVAVVGTNATDTDTGLVKTPYTLQTPAGKHDVISPLTTMVQTKIDADHAAGTTTSTEDADKYVIGQLGLDDTKVSAFDDFVAKRGESLEHKKAGERAHVLVVSTQNSIKSASTSTANNTAIGTVTTGGTESNSHATETHIENELLKKLSDIGKVSDDIEKWACASISGTVAANCDSEIHDRAPIVDPTPAPAPTPTLTPVVTSAATGKSLYSTNSCFMCHGTPPSSNKVLNGANSPDTILNAINSVGGMATYSGKFSLQQLADIAAYLATPTI